MMHLDMPLEQLKTYLGKSPKPADFDEYWDRALAELDSASLDYELVKADIEAPGVECFNLYFTGVGGAKIRCMLARPAEQKTAGPGILLFHGYSSSSGDWFDKIGYAALGFTVLAMDCRGQGGYSTDTLLVEGTNLRGHIIRGLDDPNPDHLYYRHVFLDTAHAARILMSMETVDEKRVGVYGVSQGGALAIACAALQPDVKEVVAVYPFLSDFRRVWEMDIQNTAYEEIAYFFRQFDPAHEREEEIFNRLGYIDIQNLADRIKANVLWVTAMRDMVCPPSTQFAAYNKIRSNKEMLIYYEYGHEYLLGLADIALKRFLSM